MNGVLVKKKEREELRQRRRETEIEKRKVIEKLWLINKLLCRIENQLF